MKDTAGRKFIWKTPEGVDCVACSVIRFVLLWGG